MSTSLNTAVATIALALAATSPAVAQPSESDRRKRGEDMIRSLNAGQDQPTLEGLRRDFPFLADAIAGYALGEVWSRPVLDHRTRQIAAVAAFAASGHRPFIAIALVDTSTSQSTGSEAVATHEFVGMWVTSDGYIRHELLPNNRYDEARGDRKSAYQGRYTITGNHIDYVDDTGFTADGDFIDGVLHHAGMILYRTR